MRIIDPSEKRSASLKLIEFINESMEMCKNSIEGRRSPENNPLINALFNKFFQVNTAVNKENKAFETLVIVPSNSEQRKIIFDFQQYTSFFTLNQHVKAYSHGMSLKDLFSDPNHTAQRMFGLTKVKELAPLAFSDRQAELVIAETDIAKNTVQRRAWAELRELVSLFSEASQAEISEQLQRPDTPRASYDNSTLEKLFVHIDEKISELDRHKSFDAPVRGIDYTPI